MLTEYLKLNEIISIIPLLLNYIAPGFIFCNIESFYLDTHNKSDENSLFKYILISYLFNSLLSIFLNEEDSRYSFVLFIIAFVSSALFINVTQSKYYIKLCHKLNLFKSIKIDLISDIVDSKIGMWFRVYVHEDEVIYTGVLSRYENETEDGHRYIVLTAYACHKYDGTELLNYDNDFTKCVLLNIANINRIEMIYDERSSKIEKLEKEKEHSI